LPAPFKILFVTSEIFPLIKTGGLADISGALPLALRDGGNEVRVLVPGYPTLLQQLTGAKKLADIPHISSEAGKAILLEAKLPGTDLSLLVLDCPKLYDRAGGPYLSPEGTDWPDNVLRFGVLSQVGALLASANTPLKWHPDIVHCNDWQNALIPALLHFSKVPHAHSVLSIHNLAFQGNFGAEWVPRLGLPAASFALQGVEFHGRFSFLKAGIFYADKVTTVSRTYAEEIQTAEFGYGLEGLLHERRADLTGIVNGIGSEWNPASDRYLSQNYDRNTLHKKAANKRELQRELGLQAASVPLLGLVSRLTHQKGIDLVLDCVPELLRSGVQLAVLGSGETQYEERLRELERRRPGLVSITFGYHEGLAHRMAAGSDIFLMPSRFEPCGLSQMYSMAYGTPPVVRRTGGLADTVTDTGNVSLRDGTATGFVFEHESAAGFLPAIQRALAYFQKEDTWHTIQQNGMARDFGWHTAARAYENVYREAAGLPQDASSLSAG
jgi:starch synthase